MGQTFQHKWPYQEYKTLTDIALGVIETCKLPHHVKVVTPFAFQQFFCHLITFVILTSTRSFHSYFYITR